MGLHIQLKGHQLLVFPFTEHQRHQRHVEHALLASHANILCHYRQLWQGHPADLTIATDILLRHLDELGVFYRNGIDGVGILCAQLFLPGKHWQQRVNPDLISSQVKELLCPCCLAATQEYTT